MKSIRVCSVQPLAILLNLIGFGSWPELTNLYKSVFEMPKNFAAVIGQKILLVGSSIFCISVSCFLCFRIGMTGNYRNHNTPVKLSICRKKTYLLFSVTIPENIFSWCLIYDGELECAGHEIPRAAHHGHPYFWVTASLLLTLLLRSLYILVTCFVFGHSGREQGLICATLNYAQTPRGLPEIAIAPPVVPSPGG